MQISIKVKELPDDAFLKSSQGNEIEINGFTIRKGQRIAQISLVEHKSYLFGVESEDQN